MYKALDSYEGLDRKKKNGLMCKDIKMVLECDSMYASDRVYDVLVCVHVLHGKVKFL